LAVQKPGDFSAGVHQGRIFQEKSSSVMLAHNKETGQWSIFDLLLEHSNVAGDFNG
jgi:hypothetical protein